MESRLLICGREERESSQSQGFSHLITIANPEAENIPPEWFAGGHLPLWFGDVVSKADAASYNTIAPNSGDIRQAILFFRQAWHDENAKIIVSCDYGVSRSPALAYVCLADRLGEGNECEAFERILHLRPEAVPNSLVVKIGDLLLKRDGALMTPLRRMYEEISSQCMFQTEENA